MGYAYIQNSNDGGTNYRKGNKNLSNYLWVGSKDVSQMKSEIDAEMNKLAAYTKEN